MTDKSGATIKNVGNNLDPKHPPICNFIYMKNQISKYSAISIRVVVGSNFIE